MARHLQAEVDIQASAERVWEVLTDLPAYPEWNPFIVQAAGRPLAGHLADRRGRKLVVIVGAVATGIAALPPNMLDMPIEELDLPMRAYNSLKRNNIVKVGQLLQLKDEDLLRMRNFGKKSLDEMKERLRMRGFIVPETEGDGLEGDVEDGYDDDEPES